MGEIKFEPRDIGMWRDFFDFSGGWRDYPYKCFDNLYDLTTFLCEHGVRPYDADYPLQFIYVSNCPTSGRPRMDVVQLTTIGWILL